MRLTHTVSVNVRPREPQNKNDFNKEDGKAMQQYLEEKLSEAVRGAWSFNAEVVSSHVTLSVIGK